jgi:hypothetical protein
VTPNPNSHPIFIFGNRTAAHRPASSHFHQGCCEVIFGELLGSVARQIDVQSRAGSLSICGCYKAVTQPLRFQSYNAGCTTNAVYRKGGDMSNPISAVVVCLAVLWNAPWVFAQTVGSEENKPPLSEREIRTLIDRLVSPYPKPQDGLPPGFGQDKQKAVREAVYETCTKLNALGKEAFPYLIERWEDKQYCLTVSNAPFPGCHHNLTVGDVCQRLIYGQVQPSGCRQVYGPSLSTSAIYQPPTAPSLRPVYPVVFLPSKEKARQWWEKNKGKRLQEIQLEVLDWIIAEEAKQPKEVSDLERQELQTTRRKLASSEKPLSSGVFYYYWREWEMWRGN